MDRKKYLSVVYPELKISDVDLERPCDYHARVSDLVEPPVLIQHDAADDIIYASSPVNGFPMNSCGVSRQMLTDPSIAVVVSQRMRPTLSEDGSVDISVSEEMMQRRFESTEDYMNRLREIGRAELKKQSVLQKSSDVESDKDV